MNQKLDVNVRSFVSSIIVIAILMVLSYGLTFVLPAGQYTRIIDEAGHEIIDTTVPFVLTTGDLTFVKFLFSPFLVLGSNGNLTLIEIIIFLFIIGGIFNCLERCQLLNYALNKMSYKYSNSRYKLLYVISLFFMLMGSLIGSSEEIIPLVPIITSLSVSLGFDVFTGLGISILAGACGFSAGISNPFTIGIAHEMAGIPMLSGVWYRIIVFVLEYILLMFVVISHAKKIARSQNETTNNFKDDPNFDKATNAFLIVIGAGVVICFSSIFIIFLTRFNTYYFFINILSCSCYFLYVDEIIIKIFYEVLCRRT